MRNETTGGGSSEEKEKMGTAIEYRRQEKQEMEKLK